ncbi:unnamed protein product [Lymnaea stagnalis]|uniref:ZSWIM3 N-terminal domain-containing protein n=1 Tax=Lymnaea stagnalis TaxID=6523 RepID=A0AAV2IDS4_LYMST
MTEAKRNLLTSIRKEATGSKEKEAESSLTITVGEASNFKSEFPKIELLVEFGTFLELRDALDKYQRENFVQLIVKDSKLLKAESTRKVIPKVYHLVNQSLMYHSITYCCKCHGELKQKPTGRIKNVGQKRLNCPMYIRFKLTPDLQKLVLFDMDETHNHDIDRTTFQMTPRQQLYRISRLKRKLEDGVDDDDEQNDTPLINVNKNEKRLSVSHLKQKPPKKSQKKVPKDVGNENENNVDDEELDDNHVNDSVSDEDENSTKEEHSQPESPLDSESTCSDSDDDEFRKKRQLLPFPLRLVGSAIQSSPELLMATKELIEIQKSKLLLEKQKLILETKHLELANLKLELEVRKMEKNFAADISGSGHGRDTTIFLQAN